MVSAFLFCFTACKKGGKPENTTADAPSDSAAPSPSDETTLPVEQTASVPAGEFTAAATDAQSSAAPVTQTSVSGGAAATKAASSVPAPTEETETGPALTLSASNTTGLQTGDTFTVTVGLRGVSKLASVTLNLPYDNHVLGVVGTKNTKISDFEALTKDYGGYLRYAGYTMRTVDVAEGDLFTVTFRVMTAPAEGTLTFAPEIRQFDVGLDADGAATRDIGSELRTPSVTLSFAE